MILTGALGLSLAGKTWAGPEATALLLATKGNDYVGVQSKNKIVRIHSDKSVGAVTPNVWRVEYYDPDAMMKYVEVRFENGEETDVSHPVRPFELPVDAGDAVDRAKLKVDSNQALNIAGRQTLVKSLGLHASKLTLTHSEAGPVWKVQLWATKLNEPTKDADVGTVTISATDGTVVKSDLHPGRVQ